MRYHISATTQHGIKAAKVVANPSFVEDIDRMFYLQSAMLVWRNASTMNKDRNAKIQSIVKYLDDGVLLHIFAHLQVMDLIRVGLVCRQWYRVSKDYTLWTTLDLTSIRQNITDNNNNNNMSDFFKLYPISRLVSLDLTGMNVSPKMLTLVSTSCTKLKKLFLKCVTVVGESNENGALFPRFLDHLDLRYSNGPAWFYLLASRHLTRVKWLGICDAFIYALFMDGSLETTFLDMQNLRWLDTSHCLLAKDSLVSMVSACKHLEVLSMRKCLCVRGTTLGELLSNCPNLKGLILDGTSVSDDVICSLPWERKSVEYLDLGCCWLVDIDCLSKLVKRLAYSRSLEYLGLSAIGDGKSINDDKLDQIATLTSKGLYRSLNTLNVTSSRNITMAGVMSFVKQCGDKVEIITNNCPAFDGDQSIDENNNIRTNRKCPAHFRSKRYHVMKQFDLESPL